MESTNTRDDLQHEMANALIHGIGILFCIASIPILSAIGAKTGNIPGIVGATVFSFCSLLLFTASTMYHSMQNKYAKKILRKVDHISIYFLIAGSYTPFLLIYMFDTFGITLLSIQWSLVMLGIVFKLFFTGKKEILSIIIYIAMGWLLLAGGKRFFVSLPPPVLIMLITGGGLYTLGCVFFMVKKIPHNHAIWHLFVLSAAICHYVAVLLSIILAQPAHELL